MTSFTFAAGHSLFECSHRRSNVRIIGGLGREEREEREGEIDDEEGSGREREREEARREEQFWLRLVCLNHAVNQCYNEIPVLLIHRTPSPLPPIQPPPSLSLQPPYFLSLSLSLYLSLSLTPFLVLSLLI